MGQTGYGKTFALNCYLTREYAENGIPFDLLEPMGHGQHLAKVFGLEWFSLSSKNTVLNPQDVMFAEREDQITHVIRLYETVLGRLLTGGQDQNIQRGLLGNALEVAYSGFPDLQAITPDVAPKTDLVVDILSGLGDPGSRLRMLAEHLAEEIGAMCTGNGVYARFLNGETTIDLSRQGRKWIPPRVFSFHELPPDPILQGLVNVQVLSAIRRDSLVDEQPRIIAIDEVYRLMQHPALMDFMVEAVKTFRTRRKKVISIDQNMMLFTQGKPRFLLENSPIRVIFSQKGGMNTFTDDAAFAHFNPVHLNIISSLPKFTFLLDIQSQGLYWLYNRPSPVEQVLFGAT